MQLPKEKSTPKKSLSDYTTLCYGIPKAGKTSLCAEIPDALFLSCEPGTNALSVFEIPIRSWTEFLEACKAVEQEGDRFKCLVLDTVDACHRFCSEYICKQNNVKHESELPYGRGYGLISNEFWRVISKLASLHPGMIMISHATEKEIETRTGKYTKIVPTLPDKVRRQIIGMTDFILFFDLQQLQDKDGNVTWNRVIKTKPAKDYEAGDRTGKLPETIPMSWTSLNSEFKKALGGTIQTNQKGKK
jgi:hypothetical protein